MVCTQRVNILALLQSPRGVPFLLRSPADAACFPAQFVPNAGLEITQPIAPAQRIMPP